MLTLFSVRADWAIQNAKVDVVATLLSRLDNVDVLAKNEFGKSALSEAFNAGNQEVLRLVLEHPSASEEALLGGEDGEEVDVQEGEEEGEEGAAEGGSSKKGLVHTFALDPAREGLTLSIRELVRHSE